VRERSARRALEILRDEGPRALWFRVMAETAYRRVIVMERRLDSPIPEVTSRLPVHLALLGAAELDRYAHFRPDQDPAATRLRLERGHRCFAAWHDGQIVHAGWAAVRMPWIEYLDCEFPLEAGDVYQFDSYTTPAFRGLGVAAARVVWMSRFFRDAGFRRLLAVVWPENTPGFRPLERAGYRRCGWIRVFRFARWQRIVHSGAR
jgi:RimJ/RimL family protein N-acetyltransferase